MRVYIQSGQYFREAQNKSIRVYAQVDFGEAQNKIIGVYAQSGQYHTRES